MTERAREAARNAVMSANGAPLDERSEAIANAAIDAYITAIGETHAIVPREPTEAMAKAGSYQLEPDTNEIDVARDVYEAMLNAAAPQR